MLKRGRAFLWINLALVAGLSAIVLGYGIDHSGIAQSYSDPVSKIRAQDESLYAHISLRMAQRGGWLTPVFMGRFLLQKPPLLVWLSATSLKLFGPTVAALRAPSLLTAIAATVLVFCWIVWGDSLEAAWAAVILLLSNPLWHTFARLCYIDMLFTLCVIAALYCLRVDPSLERWSFRAAFAVCTAGAIMAKSVAGLIPLMILMLCAINPGKIRVRWARVVQVSAIAAVLVLPWHAYQAWVHPQWFWNDYVQVQLLSFGTHPPSQSSNESQVWFYARRLWDTDPVLVTLAGAALLAILWRGRRDRTEYSAPLGVWIVVVVCALLAFGYRNLPYALYLIAPLAILAAVHGPGGRWRTLALAAVFVVKAFYPHQTWGLSFGRGTPLPAAEAVSSYAQQHRPNELVLVSPADELYASTLALPKVRYAFVDPAGVVARYAPSFVDLGITVTAMQFADMANLAPEFRLRLRSVGIDSDEALGTAIVMKSDDEVGSFVQANPDRDFLLPDNVGEEIPTAALAGHSVTKTSGGWLLLADKSPQNPPIPVFLQAPRW